MSTQEQRRQQLGRDFRSDLGRLVSDPLPTVALPILPKRGATPTKRGRSDWSAPQASGGGGGGIASPLTETSFLARTYHATSIILSGDFLLGVQIKPISQITMTDADGQEVLMRYAAPSGAP